MKRFVMLVLVCAFVASAASAQVVNPTRVTFSHSDYATATRYEGGYFALPVLPAGTCNLTATPATSPVQLDNLGKPSLAGEIVDAPLVARPIGCYLYGVRAYDVSGLVSPWSDLSAPFVRTPAATGRPVLR